MTALYDCSKKVAWRCDEAVELNPPLDYPKGQLQVWHTYVGGFGGADKEADAQSLRSTVGVDLLCSPPHHQCFAGILRLTSQDFGQSLGGYRTFLLF